ncbi:MAG: hypothetical protein KG003_00390 [Bacteroidetes bacterium]|nr:hypothetical protein [Bacteroidota bacterium]
MIIAIAGPYSAETAELRQHNFDVLNAVAARLLLKGHVPVIGVNAAIPVVDKALPKERRKAIMDISLAVVSCCDALLLVAESPGALEEMELVKAQGKPIYFSESEIPKYE